MLQHGGHDHVATRCDMLHEGTICRSMVARSKTPLEEAKLGGQDATAIQATMQARARCHVSVRCTLCAVCLSISCLCARARAQRGAE
jgi:hypothetical protein